MADRSFKYTLEAIYKGANEVSKFREDLKKLGKVEALGNLDKNIADVEKELRDAVKSMRDLAKEQKKTNGEIDRSGRAYTIAAKKVKILSSELRKNKNKYRELSGDLGKAGIDTKKLTGETKNLTKAIEEQSKVVAARRKLGVQSQADVAGEVSVLNKAYKDLASSGRVTDSELIQAKDALLKKTQQLTGETEDWMQVLAESVGLVAIIDTVTSGLAKAFDTFSGFETGMAEVYTLVDMSADRFADIKEEVKDVGRDLSAPMAQVTSGLYDLVSAGVDVEKSSDAIVTSSQAAQAGVTDIATAVQIGTAALNVYKRDVGDLEDVFDTLFVGVTKGVTTFPLLADNMGEVLATAQSAKVGLDEVTASMAALTKGGVKTPQAATALKGAIISMAAPAPIARRKFEELGITWEGLVPTLEAIAEKSLTINEMKMLIPNEDARTGVMSLTSNIEVLTSIMGDMEDRAGGMQKAYEKMKDTPADKIALLQKSLANLFTEIGALAAVVLVPTIELTRELINSIEDLSSGTKIWLGMSLAVGTALLTWNLGIDKLVMGAVGYSRKIGLAKKVTDLFTVSVTRANFAAGGLGSTLGKLFAIGTAFMVGWEIGSYINREFETVRAVAQKIIGQLIKGVQYLELGYYKLARGLAAWRGQETKSHDNKIAQVKREIEITNKLIEDIDNTGHAYKSKAELAAEANKKIVEDTKTIGIDEILANERKLAAMTDAYKIYVAEVKKLQDEISGRERSLAEELREMARGGMDALQAWRDRKAEAQEYYQLAEEAIANADKALAAGDKAAAEANFAQAIEFADKAKEKFKSLNKEVKIGDEVIIDQQVALREAMAGVKDAGELSIEVLKKQRDIAQKAADELDRKAEGALSADSMKKTKKEMADFEQVIVQVGDQWENMWVKAGKDAKKQFEEIEKQAKFLFGGMYEVKVHFKDIGGEDLGVQPEHVKETVESIKTIEQAIDDVTEDIRKEWADTWEDAESEVRDQVDTMEKGLEELTRDREVKIYIKEIKTGGGESSEPESAEPKKMKTGGILNGMRAYMQDMRAGGLKSGYGGGDRRHVVMEDGEGVIRKERVAETGRVATLAYNSGNYALLVRELMARRLIDTGRILKMKVGGIVDRLGAVNDLVGTIDSGRGSMASAGSGEAALGGNTFYFQMFEDKPAIKFTADQASADRWMEQMRFKQKIRSRG